MQKLQPSLLKNVDSLDLHSYFATASTSWPGARRPASTYKEMMSPGLVLGTEEEPTQMMDSLEQLQVEGQRAGFFARLPHRHTQSKTQKASIGGIPAAASTGLA